MTSKLKDSGVSALPDAPKSKKKRGNPATLVAPWKPGQSGNPKGRPKGRRNKFGEDFIQALHADFQEHGVGVIKTVREERPADYLKVCVGVLPKELNVNTNDLSELSDAELDVLGALIEEARSAVLGEARGGKGSRGAAATRH